MYLDCYKYLVNKTKLMDAEEVPNEEEIEYKMEKHERPMESKKAKIENLAKMENRNNSSSIVQTLCRILDAYKTKNSSLHEWQSRLYGL